MTITQHIAKSTNYTAASRGTSNIKYITVHYVGATGGAQANAKYFANNTVGASSHYFVGHNGEVYQSVRDKDIAWHCGTSGTYYHMSCRNSNSIGVEICCRKDSSGNWYFENATVTAAIELIKSLMAKYNIPVSNVVRHYDVTHKICPAPYVSSSSAWANFKAKLTGTSSSSTSIITASSAGPSSTSESYAKGKKITLSKVNLYTTATSSKAAAVKTGTYYIYDGKVTNNRLRITNSSGNAGKTPIAKYVTGWVNKNDI